MREMARQGYYTGGRVRFGLMLVEPENSTKGRKKFAPHPSESLIVRKVFQMAADGFSGGQIRNYLNENGYKTQEGKLFGSSYIARLIKDDIYIGTYRFKTEGYDDIVVENCIPAIIDRETFEKANLMKEKNRVNNSPNPRQTQRFYPLTGKLKCGYCGSPSIPISSSLFNRFASRFKNNPNCLACSPSANSKTSKFCIPSNLKITLYIFAPFHKKHIQPKAKKEQPRRAVC